MGRGNLFLLGLLVVIVILGSIDVYTFLQTVEQPVEEKKQVCGGK